MPKTEVKRWGYRIAVSTVFASAEPTWKDVIEKQMRYWVQYDSYALLIELEEMIDERDQPSFKAGYRGPLWPRMFFMYGVFRVTIPLA